MKPATNRSRLPEIACIETLEHIEAAYAKQHGAYPFNVSHWDPSEAFHGRMLSQLELPSFSDSINYNFSYQVTQTFEVLRKLTGQVDTHFGLFTPSCTSSILCVLNWLECQNKTEMVVACPAYFSLFHASRRFGLNLRMVYLRRSNGMFMIPQDNARFRGRPGVLWITNPVYCAGCYLNPNDILFLANLLESGWTVIADECLAIPGQELSRSLGRYPNFVGIYSPHKGVCINGIKFSVVALHASHREFFERWADVWYGGLGTSSTIAILHYLSPNFEAYSEVFFRDVANQTALFYHMCKTRSVDHDSKAEGHFRCCYFPGLPARLANSRKFLGQLVQATGGSIITGNRSRLSPTFGLSFRVNLAREGPQFQSTFARLLDHLEGCSR